MEMRRDFGEGIVRTGFDALFDGDLLTASLAFECLMGVNSRGPDGVPTIDPLLSPSPDGILISCPIQKPE